MMQTDVKSAYISGTGSALAFPTRIKGMVIVAGAGAGGIEITDGNGGATLFQINTVANETMNILIPGEGIKVNTEVYVKTFSNMTCLNIFYG